MTGLQGTHEVFFVKIGPELLGWPHVRFRTLAVLLNRKSLAWVGPRSQAALEEDFGRRFFEQGLLSGSALMTESNERRMDYYTEVANARPGQSGCAFTAADMEAMSPEERMRSMCPPGMIERFRAWQRKRVQTHVALPNREFMADIDHWPSAFSGSGSAGDKWPTQLTHGTVCAMQDMSKWRIATPLEHLGALGMPVHAWQPRHPLMDAFDVLRFKLAHIKKLSGNGMHLHSLAVWFAYVFSNIVPHSESLPMQVKMQDGWPDTDSEGEDEALVGSDLKQQRVAVDVQSPMASASGSAHMHETPAQIPGEVASPLDESAVDESVGANADSSPPGEKLPRRWMIGVLDNAGSSGADSIGPSQPHAFSAATELPEAPNNSREHADPECFVEGCSLPKSTANTFCEAHCQMYWGLLSDAKQQEWTLGAFRTAMMTPQRAANVFRAFESHSSR